MKKKALKKLNPFRHKALMLLRENGNTIETFTNMQGREIALNIGKKLLLNERYHNSEFNNELIRKSNSNYFEDMKNKKVEEKAEEKKDG